MGYLTNLHLSRNFHEMTNNLCNKYKHKHLLRNLLLFLLKTLSDAIGFNKLWNENYLMPATATSEMELSC